MAVNRHTPAGTMDTNTIRTSYLDFFRSKGHKVVQSDSLVPVNDPTLLFTGAGMNQFKEYFLGLKKDMKRATTSQKCLRTGDLDNVGKTPYHHSFFEMLGNFSFGDYFKEEAILWAMEFLTDVLRIPPDKLRVSVHRNDEEAYRIWTDKMKVPPAWVAKLGDKSNFWPANAPLDGPNGPCGPCSEIFFDQGEQYGCKMPDCGVDCDCGRFAEIWNLVFTQYDRQEGGKLLPLVAKNIDTGAGLERIACVLQGKRNNFETDGLAPLVESVLTRFGLDPKNIKSREALQFARTIVDHGRAATFAIADGAQPSNEGRGYVVRKLIRRAVWRGKSLAGDIRMKPFLAALAQEIAQRMSSPYPYLLQEMAHIRMLLDGEEERFLETLEDGKKVLRRIIDETRNRGSGEISAEEAFKLYDTYGFPDELTVALAGESGLTVDVRGFEALMEKQRQMAKDGSKIADSIFVTQDIPPALTNQPATKFLGYDTLNASGTVLFSDLKGNEGWIVLDQTPFYAEQGGQVGDHGEMRWNGGSARVLDTLKKDLWSMHRVKIEYGAILKGTTVDLSVDAERRWKIRRHHTATHLLHAALHKVLGPHARQLGSLVSSEKLRFDFSHPKSLTVDEIKEIENFVNSAILSDLPVTVTLKSLNDARQEGAIAFFGEKYKEEVRVVQVSANLSKELCGGTHVDRTGEIGILLITSESSVASGTRRIEAVAGSAALEYSRENQAKLGKIADLLKCSKDDITQRIGKLQSKVKELEKKPQAKASGTGNIAALTETSLDIKGIKVIVHELRDVEVNDLRGITDQIRKSMSAEFLVVLFTTIADSVKFVVASSSEKADASRIAARVAQGLEGSGGGKKEFAQGGSKRPDLVDKVRSYLPAILAEVLNQ